MCIFLQIKKGIGLSTMKFRPWPPASYDLERLRLQGSVSEAGASKSPYRVDAQVRAICPRRDARPRVCGTSRGPCALR